MARTVTNCPETIIKADESPESSNNIFRARQAVFKFVFRPRVFRQLGGFISFNPSIPTGTDFTLQSQAQIRANYQAIDSIFKTNHYPLTGNDNELQGKHTVLTMRPQSDPVTDSIHVGFYNKLVTAVPYLFFAPNNAQTPIQLTYSSISTAADATQQYSFVAGPFVVYGGFLPNVTIGQVVNLTPTTTLRYVGLVSANVRRTSRQNNAETIPTNITGSSFTIMYKAALIGTTITLDCYYLAIGQP